MLVDDDEITNYLSKEVLLCHFENAAIDVTMSGEEALENLVQRLQRAARLPDIMLVDINMPSMDGWEFLAMLENLSGYDFSSINIFMYTSSVFFEDINRGKNHKLLKNILTKPLDQQGISEMGKSLVQAL